MSGLDRDRFKRIKVGIKGTQSPPSAAERRRGVGVGVPVSVRPCGGAAGRTSRYSTRLAVYMRPQALPTSCGRPCAPGGRGWTMGHSFPAAAPRAHAHRGSGARTRRECGELRGDRVSYRQSPRQGHWQLQRWDMGGGAM